MLLLPDFQLHQPKTLAEAAALTAANAGHSDFLAGGTDLLCNYKWMLNNQPHVISLRHIPEMDGIERRADGSWRIGAAVTLHQMERHAALMKAFPGLLDALTHLATPLIRRTGTLAGNLLQDTRCHFFNQSAFWRESLGYCLKAEGDVCHVIPQKTTCHATYHGDVAPVLMTLDAAARLVSPAGERTIKLHDFFTGEGRVKHVKKPDEILAEVLIPAGAERLRTGYNKLRYRDAFDFPALGIAASLRLDDAKKVEALTIAVTAVLPHPYRADELTAPLLGQALTDSAIQRLCEQLRDGARPVKSLSTPPPDYRKKMVYVYARRLLERLAAC